MSDPSPSSAAPVSRARPRSHLQLGLKLGVGLAIAAVFLYLFLRETPLAKLGKALGAASPTLFLAAILVSVVGLVVRAVRWRCYLLPIKRVPLRSSYDSMIIGYAISNFLPGRPGDVIVRPLLMGRWEGIPKAAVLATVAVERLFDTIVLLLCLTVYLAFLAPATLGDLPLEPMRRWAWLLVLASFLIIAALVGIRLWQERALALLEWTLKPLPARWRAAIIKQAHAFATGLALFHDPWNAAVSMVYSVLAWVTVGVSMWLVTRSLDLAIPPQDSILLMGVGAVGVAIPTPGGAGSFDYLIMKAVQALGVSDVERAQAAAILMHLLSILPMTVLGALAVRQRGIGLGELESAVERGTAGDEAG